MPARRQEVQSVLEEMTGEPLRGKETRRAVRRALLPDPVPIDAPF